MNYSEMQYIKILYLLKNIIFENIWGPKLEGS